MERERTVLGVGDGGTVFNVHDRFIDPFAVMNEYTITYTAAGAMFGLSLSTLLYSLGGRAHKWLRRFVASLVLAVTVNVCSVVMDVWSWPQVLIYPCLIFGFCNGYSANE